MIKIRAFRNILFYIFLITSAVRVNAQSWEPLGPNDNWASVSSAVDFSMAISPVDDMVYISYSDDFETGKITVKRFNNGEWETVGNSGFSEESYKDTSLAFSPNGTLYIAYAVSNNQPDVNFDVVIVERFNGNSWEEFENVVSSESSFESSFISLDFSPDGVPYISYEDSSDTDRLTVQKHNGNSWEIVGDPGFTGNGAFSGYADFTFSPSGTPYVAHINTSNKLTIYQFNGLEWVAVTGNFVTDNRVGNVSISFSGNDNLYVAYKDLQDQNKTIVRRLNGNSWDDINTIDLNDDNAENTLISYSPDGFLYAVYETPERIIAKRFDGVSWMDVGNSSYYMTKGNQYSLVFSSNGSPYILYQDGDNLNKATVVNLQNNNWEVLGVKGFSEFYTSYSTIALSPNDEPYVAYADYGNQGRLTVQKYNGSFWETVGPIGFTNSEVDFVSIAFSFDGFPYVAYRDRLNNKANVQRYNGNSWEFVGNAGLSDEQVAFTSLKFSPEGIPYLLYKDFSRSFGRATVRRFINNAWELVGNGGFSEGEIDYPSMSFAPDGTLFVAYSLSRMGYDISVQKFENDTWKGVDNLGLFNGQSYHTSITISSEGVPYLVFQNGNAGDANVQLFNGTSWEYVGEPNFTDDGARYASIGIFEDGTPNVLYSGDNRKVALLQYNAGSWNLVGDNSISNTEAIYPDLARDSEGNLIVVYSSGYVYVKKYEAGTISNLPPEIVSDTTFFVQENTNEIINIESIDPEGETEGDGLSYSFTNENGGGEDNSLFNLNEQTGEIEFIVLPEFDNPLDIGADNEYNIQITVTDSGGLSDADNIQIIVTDNVLDLSIIEIAIININDENDFIVLSDDLVINASLFCGKSWNVIAKSSNDVESVRLELTGPISYSRTANNEPYLLFEEGTDNYHGILFQDGNYSITVTPYSDNENTGTEGNTVTTNFRINRQEALNEIILYPNPVTSEFNLIVSNCIEINEILVFDSIGRLVSRLNLKNENLGDDYKVVLPILASGVYNLMILDTADNELFVKQIIVK